MAVQNINPAPGQDDFNDFYTKYNASVDEIITSIVATTANITFNTHSGGSIVVAMPAGTDQILTGFATSITGGGPYNVDWTAGTYQINNTNYTRPLGSIAIAAADPTLGRIDLLIADTTPLVSLLTGTPSANPVAPTLPANSLVVGYIYVPAASTGNPPNTAFTALPTPSGSGETLRSDGSGNWEVNDKLTSQDNVGLFYADQLIEVKILDAVQATSLVLGTISTTWAYDNPGAVVSNNITIDQTNVTIQDNTVNGATLNVQVKEGVYIKSSIPASTVYKLHNDAGDLHWNGEKVVTAGTVFNNNLNLRAYGTSVAIDAKSIGDTIVFQPNDPKGAGNFFVVESAICFGTLIAGADVYPIVSLGITGAAYDDFVQLQTLTGLAIDTAQKLGFQTNFPLVPSGTDIYLRVDTAAGAAWSDFDMHCYIVGYYLDLL